MNKAVTFFLGNFSFRLRLGQQRDVGRRRGGIREQNILIYSSDHGQS